MTVSPLANMKYDIPALDRWQPRLGRVSGVLIHHNAGVDAYGQATAAGREVSANYWITNSGVIIPNVDEENRAFTSGMAGYPAGAEADHRFITVEVSNSPEGARNGTWAISDSAMEALARLIADVHRRYKLGPVRRGTGSGVAVHRDFVPTECPGPYMMRNLTRLIERAEQLRQNPAAVDATAATETTIVPPKRKRKNMIGLTIADGENRYKLGKNKRLYATFDGRCFVSLTKDDADAVSVNMGEAFANVSYGGWEAYRDAAEVLK